MAGNGPITSFLNEEEERRRNLERILQSPSYRVAYRDVDLLSDPRLRPTRMELELLKTELIFQEHNIRSTIVVFGAARILPPAQALRIWSLPEPDLAETPNDPPPAAGCAAGRANLCQKPLLRTGQKICPNRLRRMSEKWRL